jgi:Fe2+ or Zn2+ uptake regulation protein
MVKKRNTRQKEIIQQKLDMIDTFFNAEELFEDVRKDIKNIGIATIFRFLNELKKENKIYSYKCDRKTIFSKQNKSHCHFICESTGKITHFNIDSLDFLKDKIPGSIKSFQLEVKGICKEDCKKCSKI